MRYQCRLTDTDIAIFKKTKPTPTRYLEEPKNTHYRKIKTDIAIFFGFSSCIQPVFFHNLSYTFIWMLAWSKYMSR